MKDLITAEQIITNYTQENNNDKLNNYWELQGMYFSKGALHYTHTDV